MRIRARLLNVCIVTTFLLSILGIPAACGGGGGDVTGPPVVAPPNTTPSAITITPPSSTILEAGASVQLSAVVTNSAGTVLNGQTITWSSASSIVAVSSGGLVTVGAAAGTTSVTASVGSITSQPLALTVKATPSAITITPPPSSTLAAGGSLQLSAVVTNSAGTVLSGQTITWSSLSPVVSMRWRAWPRPASGSDGDRGARTRE